MATLSSLLFLTFLVLLCGAFATSYETLYSCKRAFKKTSRVSRGHSSSLRRRFYQKTKKSTLAPERRLLQAVSCEWDVQDDECEVSDATMGALLLDSSSPIGRFMGQIISCSAQVRKSTCQEVGYCVWNRPECIYADYSLGNEDSPCVKNAPGIFAYLDAGTQCEAHKNRIVCEAPICQWDNNESTCEADIFETFFTFGGEGDSEDIEELVDVLEGEGDRKLLSAVIECSRANNRTSCTGNCDWDAADESCDPTVQSIFTSILPEGDISGDGLCEYFEFIAESGCLAYDSEKECLADESCEYGDSCFPDTTPLVTRIIEEDAEFIGRLVAASVRCGRSETPGTCS